MTQHALPRRVRRLAHSSVFPLVALNLAVWVAGCEHGIVLTGTVEIPVAVQRELTEDAPGLLLVEVEIPKTSILAHSLGVLCSSTNMPLKVPFMHDGHGCAKEGRAIAWIERLDPNESPKPPCDLKQQVHKGLFHKERTVASGSAIVFSGNTSRFGCSSGNDAFHIILREVEKH